MLHNGPNRAKYKLFVYSSIWTIVSLPEIFRIKRNAHDDDNDSKVTGEDDKQPQNSEKIRDAIRPRQRKKDKEDTENDNIRITLYDPHHPQSFRHLGK